MTSNDNISFNICIPTINRWDLLQPHIAAYAKNFTAATIFIIDDGWQADIAADIEPYPNVKKIILNDSVAAKWNTGCKLTFGGNVSNPKSHLLILNDDVFYNRNYDDVQNMIQLFSLKKFDPSFILSIKGFCSFIISRHTFFAIGGFDENFKGAYFEDKDYERRLKLAQVSIIKTNMLDPVIFNESSSIKIMPSLNKNYQGNWEYYVKKWGGNIGGETFTKPFNK